ncbi:MAG: hypothetical protein GMKNLPBB_02023 [Myxococcota bacterium]|nr:hypothetical protein [Myxococcota bacterium]
MKPMTAAEWLEHSNQNRGAVAWLLAAALTGFYLVLYFTEWLNPAAKALGLDGKWTLYGLLYTIAIIAGGIHVMRKYRRNRYQLVRTAVVIFVQLTFAFSIPQLLKFLGKPELYFSYLWPLKIDYLDPRNFHHYPLPFVIYSIVGSFIAVPVLTLLYGKRWYCSWVCGCGGLANTFGEPWRHLSAKSGLAWRIEKITIHAVLVIAVAITSLWFASAVLPEHQPLARAGDLTRQWYGLLVVSMLSGVAGVGLYPIGGTRVWCRFFCPMAALLGLIQKLGRFRIRVKRDMCISCGLCTKYCEMGIDVRAYAQSNRGFTRASCVGCGLCAEVCPRGVLRLENVSRRDPQELTLQSFLDESWKGGYSSPAWRE